MPEESGHRLIAKFDPQNKDNKLISYYYKEVAKPTYNFKKEITDAEKDAEKEQKKELSDAEKEQKKQEIKRKYNKKQ